MTGQTLVPNLEFNNPDTDGHAVLDRFPGARELFKTMFSASWDTAADAEQVASIMGKWLIEMIERYKQSN